MEGLRDLVVRGVHLEQEHSWLAAVRTGNDLRGGEVLKVKPPTFEVKWRLWTSQSSKSVS